MTATRERAPAGQSPRTRARVPFDVVDEAVRLLDTGSEPWSIQLEVELAGALDESRLRSAVAEALARHPMALAHEAPGARSSKRRYEWEIDAEPELDPLALVDCASEEQLVAARARLQGISVPLTESPPLRLRHVRRPLGDAVMLNLNHAASDAIGGVRFLRSASRAYVGAPDPVPDVDPLEARDLGALVGAADPATRARRAGIVAEKARDFLLPPPRIVPEAGSDLPGNGFELVSLDRAETAALVDAARPATANDLLIAALHLTIAAWNRERGAPARRISVMVPLDLRPPAWQGEVMGNLILPVRVTTDGRDRATPAAALDAIAGQTRRLKERPLRPALIELLRHGSRAPLWAKEAGSPLLRLATRRIADTALLSNLGPIDDPPTFGEEADGARLWFSPPARMPLGLAVGALTLGGRLQLAFRYRHPLLGAEAAARFAERYVSTLGRWAR